MTLKVTSTAFEEGAVIPKNYTADGRDISPALSWLEPPAGTQSFALICEDPDAPRGTYTHWILFNLPATMRELSEDSPRTPQWANGAIQGTNDFGKIGYNGPSPPPGNAHRYFFKLFAVDRLLKLQTGATREQLLAALAGHILAEGHVMGTYQRHK